MPIIVRVLISLLCVALLILAPPQVGHSDHGLAMAALFAGVTNLDPDIITMPVAAFCRASGLGLTKVYDLLNRGELQSVTIGRRRLVVIASYHRLIARQLGTPAQEPVARPPLRAGTRRAARASETVSPQ